jgi:hypothetical protein
MLINDFFVRNLNGTLGTLKMTLADMSDADLMQRPAPAANHANWQIGHLINSEAQFMAKCGAKMPELPAGFAQRYTKATANSNDASQFAAKAQLLDLFEKVRAATVAFAQTATEAQLDAAGPMPQLAPKVIDTLSLATGHVWMHLGQIQVLRRKLGKPVLF